MKVLFRFGDNDFSVTFKEVFKLLRVKHERDDISGFSKQRICDFINMLSWPIYLTIQSDKITTEDGNAFLRKAEEGYRDYLKAYPKDILLNDEVDEHLRTNASQANYAWYVYDSTQTQPEWKVYEV